MRHADLRREAASVIAETASALLCDTNRGFGQMERSRKKMREKRCLQNHEVYQRTKMILRNPLASPVRGPRQNGHAPSRALGWARKAIYAGYVLISLDAGSTKAMRRTSSLSDSSF